MSSGDKNVSPWGKKVRAATWEQSLVQTTIKSETGFHCQCSSDKRDGAVSRLCDAAINRPGIASFLEQILDTGKQKKTTTEWGPSSKQNDFLVRQEGITVAVLYLLWWQHVVIIFYSVLKFAVHKAELNSDLTWCVLACLGEWCYPKYWNLHWWF